jgi:ribosomal protein S18 acetylase RimI-like enzyme
MESVEIRAIRYDDLDDIAAIDRKVLGKDRRDYWQMKIELSDKRSPIASLVAVLKGQVVGFILGDASGWEYGIPDTVGYIDTIGVDPQHSSRGIGRLLVQEMVSNLKKVGVSTVYTFVNKDDPDLMKFFMKLGFTVGDMINLQLKL